MAIWIRTDRIIETIVPTHPGGPFSDRDIRRHVGGNFETIHLKDEDVMYVSKTKGRDDNPEATKYARERGWEPGDGQPIHGNAVVLHRGERLAETA